ncbi:MAG TPA: hypothetical protein DCF91_10625 [Porphyromonadaceae bacterium]|nr:hypothetical protein [Porphyromonadaceae bacterium]
MKFKQILLLSCIALMASCQKGLVYEDVPESVYSEVGVKSDLCNLRMRELFNQKIWQVNYNKWTDMILTVYIDAPYKAGGDYTNKTESPVTIMGKQVLPGETVKVKNIITAEDDASAPDGKKYILNVFAKPTAKYVTPNKGHLFAEFAFNGDPVIPTFVDLVDGKTQTIILPTRQNDMIVEIILNDPGACEITPMGDSPKLGTPGDFTKPRQYMVTNISRRPDGQPAARKLYEVRVQVLP